MCLFIVPGLRSSGLNGVFAVFFGYFFGTAILANVVLGYVAEMAGWDWTFILLLIACALSIILMSFTYKDEKALLAEKNKH